MGIVKVPGGSLKEINSRHASIILPDGNVLKPCSYGHGRNFGYSYSKSGEVVDFGKLDYSEWEIVEGTTNEKKKTMTVLFGCRGGAADDFSN